MIPPDDKPYQAVYFSECIDSFFIACGYSTEKIQQFCLLAYPFNQKFTALLKQFYNKKKTNLASAILMPIHRKYDAAADHHASLLERTVPYTP